MSIDSVFDKSKPIVVLSNICQTNTGRNNKVILKYVDSVVFTYCCIFVIQLFCCLNLCLSTVVERQDMPQCISSILATVCRPVAAGNGMKT